MLLFAPAMLADECMTNRVLSITWPKPGDAFTLSTLIKIEVNVLNQADVRIVDYFSGTNHIGSSSTPPFTVLWEVGTGIRLHPDFPSLSLKAVATFADGTAAGSAPVEIYYFTGRAPSPVVEILSPAQGSILPAPGSFSFVAEVMASLGDRGPVEFFVGTNSVGKVDLGGRFTADTPPICVPVTGLPVGQYQLSLRYLGANFTQYPWRLYAKNISVVNLGLEAPFINTRTNFSFTGVTAFPDNNTWIESSSDLVHWLPILTNIATASHHFRVTDNSPTQEKRFYRLRIPSQ